MQARRSPDAGQLDLASQARVEVPCAVDGDVDLVFGLTWRHLRHRYGAGCFAVDDGGRIVYANVAGTASTIE